MIFSFGLIAVGVSAGADIVLSHGFSEAWTEWKDGRLQMAISGACLITGIGGVIIFPLIDFLADLRRYRARKAYGERYK